MADFLTAVDLPYFVGHGDGVPYPIRNRNRRPCKCVCVPAGASVVYQSRSGSGMKKGFTGFETPGTFYRKSSGTGKVEVINQGETTDGDRILQLVDDNAPDDADNYVFTALNGTYSRNEDNTMEATCGDETYQHGEVIAMSGTLQQSNPEGVCPFTGFCADGYSKEYVAEGTSSFTSCQQTGEDPDTGVPIFQPVTSVTDITENVQAGIVYADTVVSNTQMKKDPNVGNTQTSGSLTLSDEFTEGDMQALADGALAAANYLNVNIALSIFRSYRPRLRRLNFNTEESYNKALSNRVEDDEDNVISAQSTVDFYTDRVADLIQAKADTESDIASLKSDYASEIVEFNQKRQQISDKDNRRIWVRHQLLYKELSESEESALENERDQLTSEIDDLLAELPNPSGTLASIHSTEDSLPGHDESIDEANDQLTIAQANLSEANKKKAAGVTNSAVHWLTYLSSSSSVAHHSINEYRDSMSKGELRYRVRLPLIGYDLTGGVSIKLSWRERTWQHEQREEGVSDKDTYTWTERSATVTANKGDYEATTGWFTVSAPAEHMSVTVVGVKGMSQLSVGEIQYQGGSVEKKGVFSYQENDPIKVYRTETFNGSFAGCQDLNLDPKSYSGVREWDLEGVYSTPTAFSEDLVAAQGSANWPEGFLLQPSTSSKLTGLRPLKPQSESDTEREYKREIICNENTLEQNLKSTLSNEYTTAQLKSRLNSEVSGDWPTLLGSRLSGSPYGSYVAANYLHNNEVKYQRQRFRVKFRGELTSSALEARSEDFSYVKKTLNVITGAVTETTITKSFSYEKGESSKKDADYEIIDAGNNEIIWIEDLKGSERDEYEDGILVEPQEEPLDFNA
ncbi:hypothetical protein [Rubellicoccus peritrichatus]|uniref:Uncharacterized protein n=1 Tax=Rubellicoccus peritrichatus TaxID=3080537 RepID=A0AAQ3L7I3_9BACT|nr:hypothetical protein [Puniceicoccus sp. CR14]WOO40372.1 hypothetical protein RZN69_17270 [Puniceicoccus sp. CR14]WOO40421.1 hypothetical protein RZN69_17515 [Puniceicoccus sp. CR14]WOO40470.1 hypothetical protein RZN69_17760 [Puniceicoccus sp. CR14]WOO40519.1 hypothetical protein RZN69_18005 [Puniceicoccus sp. CR14]